MADTITIDSAKDLAEERLKQNENERNYLKVIKENLEKLEGMYPDYLLSTLPDVDETKWSKEDKEMEDDMTMQEVASSEDVRHMYVDHTDENDPDSSITGVTIEKGNGDVVLDKDLSSPIPVVTQDEALQKALEKLNEVAHTLGLKVSKEVDTPTEANQTKDEFIEEAKKQGNTEALLKASDTMRSYNNVRQYDKGNSYAEGLKEEDRKEEEYISSSLGLVPKSTYDELLQYGPLNEESYKRYMYDITLPDNENKRYITPLREDSKENPITDEEYEENSRVNKENYAYFDAQKDIYKTLNQKREDVIKDLCHNDSIGNSKTLEALDKALAKYSDQEGNNANTSLEKISDKDLVSSISKSINSSLSVSTDPELTKNLKDVQDSILTTLNKVPEVLEKGKELSFPDFASSYDALSGEEETKLQDKTINSTENINEDGKETRGSQDTVTPTENGQLFVFTHSDPYSSSSAINGVLLTNEKGELSEYYPFNKPVSNAKLSENLQNLENECTLFQKKYGGEMTSLPFFRSVNDYGKLYKNTEDLLLKNGKQDEVEYLKSLLFTSKEKGLDPASVSLKDPKVASALLETANSGIGGIKFDTKTLNAIKAIQDNATKERAELIDNIKKETDGKILFADMNLRKDMLAITRPFSKEALEEIKKGDKEEEKQQQRVDRFKFSCKFLQDPNGNTIGRKSFKEFKKLMKEGDPAGGHYVYDKNGNVKKDKNGNPIKKGGISKANEHLLSNPFYMLLRGIKVGFLSGREFRRAKSCINRAVSTEAMKRQEERRKNLKEVKKEAKAFEKSHPNFNVPLNTLPDDALYNAKYVPRPGDRAYSQFSSVEKIALNTTKDIMQTRLDKKENVTMKDFRDELNKQGLMAMKDISNEDFEALVTHKSEILEERKEEIKNYKDQVKGPENVNTQNNVNTSNTAKPGAEAPRIKR